MLSQGLRRSSLHLGRLGTALGIDLLLLFVATAVGAGRVVLVTGGLASVVLGPIWWIGVSRFLWSPALDPRVPRVGAIGAHPATAARAGA